MWRTVRCCVDSRMQTYALQFLHEKIVGSDSVQLLLLSKFDKRRNISKLQTQWRIIYSKIRLISQRRASRKLWLLSVIWQAQGNPLDARAQQVAHFLRVCCCGLVFSDISRRPQTRYNSCCWKVANLVTRFYVKGANIKRVAQREIKYSKYKFA